MLFTVGRKGQAIDLYLKGIEELNKGIALDVTGQGQLSNSFVFNRSVSLFSNTQHSMTEITKNR